jgi:hypothetical protein
VGIHPPAARHWLRRRPLLNALDPDPEVARDGCHGKCAMARVTRAILELHCSPCPSSPFGPDAVAARTSGDIYCIDLDVALRRKLPVWPGSQHGTVSTVVMLACWPTQRQYSMHSTACELAPANGSYARRLCAANTYIPKLPHQLGHSGLQRDRRGGPRVHSLVRPIALVTGSLPHAFAEGFGHQIERVQDVVATISSWQIAWVLVDVETVG